VKILFWVLWYSREITVKKSEDDAIGIYLVALRFVEESERFESMTMQSAEASKQSAEVTKRFTEASKEVFSAKKPKNRLFCGLFVAK